MIDNGSWRGIEKILYEPKARSLRGGKESRYIGRIYSDLFMTTVHDPDYRTSWNDWLTFVESLTEKIIEKDETIPELPPKDLIFRIYRDIRFSSDPTPYKVSDPF